MGSQKHIINKVFLEINSNSSKEAFDLKDNLSVFLRHRVFPKIESYFELKNKAFGEATLRFDKIEVDLDHADLGNLNDLETQLVTKIKKEINALIQEATINPEDQNQLVVLSKTKSKMDAFFYFLRTGSKPWWQSNLAELLNENSIKDLISDPGFHSRFAKVVAFEAARQRLINQFNDSTLLLLLAVTNPKEIQDKRKTFSILEKNEELRNRFWIAIIDHYRRNDVGKVKTILRQFNIDKTINAIDSQMLKNFTTSIIDKPLKNEEILELPPEKEVLPNVIPMEEGLFINNSGLVLLHPFFMQLFKNADITDTDGTIIQSKVETAIHLLHYLCTKQEQQLESELVLEKFLCGFPIDQPMQRFIELPQELKDMAEEVLQAAINHWTALKSTSPDGLRTGFLQREGKLIVDNGSSKLIVERKGVDVLLDSIPWNIHLIKLPWHDEIIHVEW